MTTERDRLDATIRAAIEAHAANPAVPPLRPGNVPRDALLRVAAQLRRDLNEAGDDLERTNAALERFRYRPLWGAARTPSAALEAKWAMLSQFKGLFLDKRVILDAGERPVKDYDQQVAALSAALASGEVYALSGHIQDLVWAAAEQLPASTGYSITDCPAPTGVIVGERRLPGGIDALGWFARSTHEEGYVSTVMMSYAEPSDPERETPFGFVQWRPDQALAEIDESDTTEWVGDARILAVRRFMAAFSYFVQQRVLVGSPERADRATRRRLGRAGFDAEQGIQVIQLRATAGRTHEPGEATDVEWATRWIVRGHWRQQPYGPGRSLVKPIWISPYVKGPEDKPVRVNTRLFEVSR